MLVLNNLIEFLKQEGVSAQLVEEVRHYSEEHTVDEACLLYTSDAADEL